MRTLSRWIVLVAFGTAAWLGPAPLVQAANLDTNADRFIGQPDFTHGNAAVSTTARSVKSAWISMVVSNNK